MVALLSLPVDGILAGHGSELPGRYVVAYDESRRVIEVIGPFLDGVAEQVRVLLNEHPQVTTLHLTSPGGLVVEGRRLRDLIYARGIDTYVRSYCVSACTLAFVGGRQRTVYRNAVIGFHQYGGFPGQSLRDHWQDTDRSYFRGRGIADDFVDDMFRAEHEDLWQLTAEEAVQAKVASRVAASFDAPPDGFYSFEAWRAFEAGQGGYAPLYAALQRHEPADHREATVIALDSIVAEESSEAVGQAGLLVGARVYEKLLATTSNEASRDVAAAFAALMADLRSSGAEACLAILDAEDGIVPGEDDYRRYRSTTMVRLAVAYAAVVRDAHERPRPKLTAEEVEQALDGFERILSKSDIVDDLGILGDRQAHRRDPDRTCRLYQRLFELLANEPPERGGVYLKALMAD
jgi:hypothetical protein